MILLLACAGRVPPAPAGSPPEVEELRASTQAVVDKNFNPGRGRAAAARAAELGLEPEREWIDWFSVQRNVFVELPGGDEVVYLVAHYDKVDLNPLAVVSTMVNGALDPLVSWSFLSDGAVDNATGVAVVLQLAKDLSELEDRRYTYRVLLAGSEESGLRGTRAHLARRSYEDKERIVLAVNVDTTGLSTTGNCLVEVGSADTRRAALAAADELDVPLQVTPLPPGASSDHAPFEKNGPGRDVGRSFLFNLPGALLPQRSYFTSRSETEVLFMSACELIDVWDYVGGCLCLPTGNLHGPRDSAEKVDPERLWQSYAVLREVLLKGEAEGLPLP